MAVRLVNLLIIAVYFSLFFSGCDNISDPESVNDSTIPKNYQLIWSDEFNEDELNSNHWGFDIGYGDNGWGNDEWQLYTDSPENIKVEDGNMVITAVWDSTNYSAPGKRDGSVTSARVNTKDKFSFKYGKIQARIKAPTDMGMWPAFWMLGASFDSIGWPYCGEIDIMEISPLYHGDKTTMCTVHWWDEMNENHSSFGTTKQLTTSLSDNYHIYEIEWDEQRIIGKIDGITYFMKVIDSTTMNEFQRDFFIILNVAVGGNLGGTPDATTQWPQSMYVDWVRVYQAEETLIPLETFGIFTDETPVDDGLMIGSDSEIYVWENTLTSGSIPPFEGANVISWATTGQGWFGGGIASNIPLDLSDFTYGYLKFMIQIPANVSFKIGINDVSSTENFVHFPASQTAYGLERNGEWGQAIIPITDVKGNVDLQVINYPFMILEENGTQCQLAIDDIYWDGGGTVASSINFDADSYDEFSTNATISVFDEPLANSTVSVIIDNANDSINIDVSLDENGQGSSLIYFGNTDDSSDTIEITKGNTLTAIYTDSNGILKTDTALITGDSSESTAFGIYTDLTPVYDELLIDENAFIYVWENTLTNGSIPPFEGENVISWQTAGIGWFGAGIASASAIDFSAFGSGSIKFMIKIPANVTFKIGINDTSGNESYAQFPANQTAYGLERNGEWGQAVIPISNIQGNVDLQLINYSFIILEENGTQCEFALDDIYWDLEAIEPPPSGEHAGIYSESHTDIMLTYDQIINSADWGGNGASPDEQSTAVSPVDGNYVLAVAFSNLGDAWSGIAFDYSSSNVDISSYNTFILNVNSSEMNTLSQLGLKIEDGDGGEFEINLSNYTPEIGEQWKRYEILLSAFASVNLANVKYILLVNPMDSSNNQLFGNLYFDDLYVEE